MHRDSAWSGLCFPCGQARAVKASLKISLERRLFVSALCFSLAIALGLSALLTSIFYAASESEAEATLLSETRFLASCIDESPENAESILAQQRNERIRYVLVSPEGTLLFDSAQEGLPVPDRTLDDHSGRPEILMAMAGGEGQISRYSTTMSTDSIYAAVMLGEGNVLRLSESRRSVAAFLASCAPYLAVCLALVAVASLVVSRVLTRYIMRPFTSIEDPIGLDGKDTTYVELEPLFARIHTQQDELMRQNEALERAAKMRQDFSANVSHEMKTPLQVISGYAELMKAGIVEEERIKAFSGIIVEESGRLQTLIDDVLTLSELDALDPGDAGDEITNVRSVVDEVVSRLSALAQRSNIAIELHSSCDDACVRATRSSVERIVTNIAENALKYNREGGTVRLYLDSASADGSASPNGFASAADPASADSSASPNGFASAAGFVSLNGFASADDPASADSSASLSALASADGSASADSSASPNEIALYMANSGDAKIFVGDSFVRLMIEDSGIGIPPQYREQVFERFFRVEKSRSKETGGTGLGLAIVKHTVGVMGGEVSIEQSELGGAKFVVVLPRVR